MQVAGPATAELLQKDNRKTIHAWAMYDWANSVYALVISSSIFPIFYENVTTEYVSILGREFRNTALFSYTLSAAFFLVALITPLLSGIADYSGSKKSFMKAFCYLGAISCVLLYFFSAEYLATSLAVSALAAVGFSGSQVFYNAYLPEIASTTNQDRVSARGYALGYVGSVLLLLVNLAMVMQPQLFGMADTTTAARYSFVMVGIWWAGFAQITFHRLPGNVYRKKVKGEYLYKGYLELRKVWLELKGTTRLKRYLLAFFVFNMGVQTVMYMAVSFAKNEIVDMPDSGLITSILIIQLIAVAGAFFFSWLSSKLGNKRALIFSVALWVLVCVFAYFVYYAYQFYALAALVGCVMGGIQSLSRSTYSKYLPDTIDHTSYFSFYDVCDKMGIVLGTLGFGLIFELTGSLRNSVLLIGSFFVIGIALLWLVPKRELGSGADESHLK